MLEVGQTAPDFSLYDQDGTLHTLLQYRGSYVFLYFYPKDNTPGCTLEACSIRDRWQDFESAGVVVLGVSADDQKSHLQFATTHKLPFPVLSDGKKLMIEAYDAIGQRKMFGKTFIGIKRVSYLISPEGKIIKNYPNVNPINHIGKVLKDVTATARVVSAE